MCVCVCVCVWVWCVCGCGVYSMTLYMYPTAFEQYVCMELWRHIDLHTHTHAPTHTYTHTYTCTHTHTHTYTHTHPHTHTHTHTHTPTTPTHTHTHTPSPPSPWSRVWGVYSSTLRSNCTRAAPVLRYMTTIVFIPCFGVFVHVYPLYEHKQLELSVNVINTLRYCTHCRCYTV